jgi:hypothetical protein
MGVIETIGRLLDPIIAVREGGHRASRARRDRGLQDTQDRVGAIVTR